MEWIVIGISVIMLLALIFAFVGMLNSSTGKPNDYDLYGMDSDEYLKKQVGEEYYNKYYKHQI